MYTCLFTNCVASRYHGNETKYFFKWDTKGSYVVRDFGGFNDTAVCQEEELTGVVSFVCYMISFQVSRSQMLRGLTEFKEKSINISITVMEMLTLL